MGCSAELRHSAVCNAVPHGSGLRSTETRAAPFLIYSMLSIEAPFGIGKSKSPAFHDTN
uniref:Uncharacterized protein n=1 Tax=Anguilla anguilla TaxID=7936 RepID=A0A0E9TIG8_ANGAN